MSTRQSLLNKYSDENVVKLEEESITHHCYVLSLGNVTVIKNVSFVLSSINSVFAVSKNKIYRIIGTIRKNIYIHHRDLLALAIDDHDLYFIDTKMNVYVFKINELNVRFCSKITNDQFNGRLVYLGNRYVSFKNNDLKILPDKSLVIKTDDYTYYLSYTPL